MCAAQYQYDKHQIPKNRKHHGKCRVFSLYYSCILIGRVDYLVGYNTTIYRDMIYNQVFKET